MKIAFINEADQHIGIQYLTAVLKANGHEVRTFSDPRLFNDLYITIRSLNRIFDFQDAILKDIAEFNPGLIGFSVSSPIYQWACTLAAKIKKRMDIPIIFGGVHSTAVPERVIQKNFIDMVCVGEGEFPILELANSMDRGQPDYTIKNIWFKTPQGEIIRNEIRPLIADLDALPFPDQDLFYSSSSYDTRSYVTMISRGCPHSCSYCTMSYLHDFYHGKGKRIRLRSVQSIINEISGVLQKHKNIKRVMFPDNCFGTDIAWLREFSREYSHKIAREFFCVMHPASVTQEAVACLKEAGCRSISLGIQAWDAPLRYTLLNRKVSNEVMENALRLILGARIELLIDNLFDFPEYSMERYIESLEIYTRYKPTRNYFYKLHFYPHTQMSQIAVQNHWITAAEYEDCLEGGDTLGILRYDTSHGDGGPRSGRESKQAQILFVLMDLIPARWTKIIIQKKWYRYFPPFLNPALLTMLRTLLANDFESRYFKDITFWRYRHFMIKKLKTYFRKK
ncbi:MAG TPA: radical SAM protein [Candidatus Omnitrophota bacterium]|nr:radical SAM protein [Candidatus Omnitrophota bacterium]HQP12170.1 radical SAM protein [Candidatus Omnitrophota bacterium]